MRRVDIVDVLILAGGKSQRMGSDKASLRVDGVPLIARVGRAISHLGNVFVVGGSADLLTMMREHCGEVGGVTHLADASEDPGPFGAIVHGLTATTANEILIVSCDLAALRRDEVDQLLDARRSGDAEVSVPMVGGRRQWHALAISSRIIPSLTQSHHSGVRSLHRGFSGYQESVVVSADPTFFSDLDTPEDLQRFSASETPRR